MRTAAISLSLALLLATPLAFTSVTPALAHKQKWHHKHGHYPREAYFEGYGRQPVAYYRDGVPFFRTKAGKIVKGSLIGAGIGAIAGAGIQAARYNGW